MMDKEGFPPMPKKWPPRDRDPFRTLDDPDGGEKAAESAGSPPLSSIALDPHIVDPDGNIRIGQIQAGTITGYSARIPEWYMRIPAGRPNWWRRFWAWALLGASWERL